MAKKISVELVDDLDGSVITSDGGTVEFSVGGATYEIDLTGAHRREFEALFAPYLAAARKVSGGARRAKTAASAGGPTPAQVRAWATANGYDVPSRGRLPQTVTDAYLAAH